MASLPQPEDRSTDHDELVQDLLPYVAGLNAETEADHENHLRARVALLNCLQTDPDVLDRFVGWTEGTQLGRAAVRISLCWDRLDRVATRAGFSSWADAEAHKRPDGEIPLRVEPDDGGVAIQRELDMTSDECDLAADELEAALAALAESKEIDWLYTEATAFVRQWPQSWPWMVYELVALWTSGVLEAIDRKPRFHNYWLASPWELPAAKIEIRSGETLAEAMARLIVETLAGRPSLPSGRRADPENIKRNVEWWYRHHIRGESKNRIALDDAGGDRALVRKGIRRAQQWFDVANWVWRDEDAA